MKRHILLYAGIFLILFFLIGCASAFRTTVLPPYGTTFNKTSAPVDITFDKTNIGSKTGTASAKSFVGVVSVGDASIGAAAQNGNIKTIDHVDCDIFNVLGVFTKYTTIVYGE